MVLEQELNNNIMEQRIWKYQLEITDDQVISMPTGAEILTVQMQNGKPCLWALVDPNEETKTYRLIQIYGTGNPIPDGNRRYISTIQIFNGDLIFHVFERV